MIKLTREARSWYRSAMVWFLGLAGVMQAVQMALPQVQSLLPDGWYDGAMGVCVFIAGVARFVRQPKLQASVDSKEAGDHVE